VDIIQLQFKLQNSINTLCPICLGDYMCWHPGHWFDAEVRGWKDLSPQFPVASHVCMCSQVASKECFGLTWKKAKYHLSQLGSPSVDGGGDAILLHRWFLEESKLDAFHAHHHCCPGSKKPIYASQLTSHLPRQIMLIGIAQNLPLNFLTIALIDSFFFFFLFITWDSEQNI